MPFHALADAPSLAEDYAKLGTLYPGSPSYDANVRRYVSDWKAYWSDYVPDMITTKAVPDNAAWGVYPTVTSADNASDATQNYNVMVHSFTPAALRGVVFVTSPTMFTGDERARFAEQARVLAQAWRQRLGGDPAFVMTVPDREIKDQLNRPPSKQSLLPLVAMPSAEGAGRASVEALIDYLIDVAYE